MRNEGSYKHVGGSVLEQLYFYYFKLCKNDNTNHAIPTAHIYQEEYSNHGQTMHYKLIETRAEPSEGQPLRILKKKRLVKNELTKKNEEKEHYELLVKFE